ncbi:ABC transporter ATP-binding protein [Paenibacillus sp. NFR01]|uniref:ABC transporter ATP-binding protein n=1 Tax=Paenibacillus sp. NFR01 TaxID=1566279 RepID=UPI0020C9014C|nr:ABC transporter ATP-binding protein [Paenibacillus sp. NFR01]
MIHGLSLYAEEGEFVSVVGASGCGKSTLFKLIAGLLEPAAGEIRLGGTTAPASGRLGAVAYMPQGDLLLPWRTVLGNCLLPWELKRGAPRQDVVPQILKMLERFGLAGKATAYPEELSGGMRQRAALLRTLVAGGEPLLLDEPFGALDAITKRELHRWLLEMWSGLSRTVLLITHDLEEALLLSDRIYLMEAGTGRLQEIRVDLPRPRHGDMRFEPSFIALRALLERELDARED